MTDESFTKANRIKSPREFEKTFKNGVIVADDILILHASASPNSTPRLGVAISKKAGNAPYRNHWKRLVREAFRRNKKSFPNFDFIVRPKRGSNPTYQTILRSLPRLVARVEKKLSKQPDAPKPPH